MGILWELFSFSVRFDLRDLAGLVGGVDGWILEVVESLLENVVVPANGRIQKGCLFFGPRQKVMYKLYFLQLTAESLVLGGVI